jgi:hypothetical protein
MAESKQEKDSTEDDELGIAEPNPTDEPILIDEEAEDGDEAETQVWCSHCGSHYTRSSSRRTLGDWFLMLVSFRTFRCHSCYRRFHQFVPPGTVVKSWSPEEARKEAAAESEQPISGDR